MNIVIGIAANGEHPRFERWAYETWCRGYMNDPWLEAQFLRCRGRFQIWY